ncbi:trihelix transcription factor GTL2 [Salvia miltiorrhiza]|uniref:trihelix transcription factor GTL2 n=1 Tax=Salvia miltiorrhiza TaxID=226208 RepID=UPI0025ACD1E7|nr:trihelix transcription factor GTL2 [Salvia miltiorrhiza]
MFDGSEQFHQFIASSRASLPISLPFPTLPSFDPYAPPLHHPSSAKKYPLISTNLALESDPSTADPWSHDELLALLKLRSTMEIWFPDFTWEHVSRKLGELGFKRSGEECKEKFEEESCRHFAASKSYRILSELDEFYPQVPARQGQEDEAETSKNDEDVVILRNPEAEAAAEEAEEKGDKSRSKRKRRDKLEATFKGFCEAVVSKMMAKQEELHRRLMDDVVRREEEKIAREEAWRGREAERARRELEARSKEQKTAAERQATIIDFLKHFSGSSSASRSPELVDASNSNVSNSSASFHPAAPPSPSSGAGGAGRRWPRDEVQALIKLRCKAGGGGGGEEEGGKGPLWERISKGMMEMGYKRSAKRCKEKWENINKYFRKTRDSSKKRSVNSRTCPYFHQLSCLYSDGTIVAPNRSDAEMN